MVSVVIDYSERKREKTRRSSSGTGLNKLKQDNKSTSVQSVDMYIAPVLTIYTIFYVYVSYNGTHL